MDILDTIKRILESEVMVEVPLDRMALSDSLRDAYGLDSLGFVELRVQCEDRFGITISDDDFSPDNFATLGSVAELIANLIDKSNASV